MSELGYIAAPAHWETKSLNDVVEINPRFDKSGIADDTVVSFVPMPAVEAESGAIDVSATKLFSEVKKGYTGFLKGDVLFAKITPCMENGKMAVVPELTNGIGFGSTEFHVLRPKPIVLAKYIYYFVSSKQFRAEAEHNMTGAVGQKRVPKLFLENAKIPVPPIDEQKDIVELMEELFSELYNGIESLKTAREQLKVYRQAVLKHAFEGKLTAQWREENKDKLESPEQLLARIQREREARYQQQLEEWKAAVKAWEAGAKERNRPGKPRAAKELSKFSEDDLEQLPRLPESWRWVKIDQICSHDENAIKAGPFGSALKKEFYTQEGYKIYGQEQVIAGNPYIGDYYIDQSKYDDLESCSVKPGDILISLVGTVGKVLVLPSNTQAGIINPRLIKVSPNIEFFNPEFFKFYFESAFVRGLYKTKTHGATMDVMNLSIIQEIPFPFFSLSEQAEIVVTLEAIHSEIENLDRQMMCELQRAENLRQSVLKKAFSGSLIF